MSPGRALRRVSALAAPVLRRPAAVRLLLLVALGFSLARVLAPDTFHLASGDLTVRMRPGIPGGTISLELGPLGELEWRTHRAPLDVQTSFLPRAGAKRLPDVSDLGQLRFGILAKLPWIALSGGLLALIVTDRRRSLASAAVGAVAFLAAGGLLVATSALTFNPQAFRSPRYRGPIEDAPRILQLLKEVGSDWPGVERNLGKLAAGLERIHSQIVAGRPATTEKTVKLLVISDIHNNPIGLLAAKELAERFHADAVLNAGDFTDRGTATEGEIFARFSSLGVPQVIVAGNHEDAATLERVRRIPRATLLEAGKTDFVEIGGVGILGDGDPNAYSIDSDPQNELADAEIPWRCERLRGRLEETGARVLLVHDPRIGECAARWAEETGHSLVFAWGHLHRPAYEERGTVLGISPGTSGANGIKTGKIAPYGFAFLEFDTSTRAVVSACLFQLEGPGSLRQASCHILPTTASRTVADAPDLTNP